MYSIHISNRKIRFKHSIFGNLIVLRKKNDNDKLLNIFITLNILSHKFSNHNLDSRFIE